MNLSEPTQLQRDYAELIAKYLHQNYTKAMFVSFRAEFDHLIARHKLYELKYAVQRPDPTVDRQTIIITPMTAASEIVLLYMMGRL